MKLGINTMSIMRALREDFDGTIETLHEAGCTGIEGMSDWGATQETIDFYAQFTGGGAGWNPDVMEARLAVLQKYGMRVDGLFIFDECILEQAEALGKHCSAFGIHYVVFTFLHFADLEEVYEKIDLVKQVSGTLAPYGVQVLIHNHESDFRTMVDRDGVEKTIVQLFLEHTTRAELMLEVDVGWVHYAGVDPAQFVQAHLDRIAVLHLKDLHADYRNMHHDTVSVACGSGVVDFPAIFAAIPAQRLEKIRLVLDQDSSQGSILADHAASFSYFRELLH